jgi:pimeloyl-ACP methyl ester carboxylesterase
MKRVLAVTAIGLMGLLLVAAVAALGYRAWRQHEIAQQLAIDTTRGIDEALFVELGGIPQWITIRGEDRNNPVLLILAGGPGNSLVPLAPVFRGWEPMFTVVQWDQRGAGKTYGANGTAEAPMTIARMVADGVELSRYLLEHLQQPTLALVGHSWGSMLGVLMVKQAPDLYCAYVGTGQVVAKAEKETILYTVLLDKLRAAHDDAAIAELTAVGPPPYASEHDLLVQRRLSERFDTDAERNLEDALRPVVLFAPNFSLADIWSLLQGQKFAGDALYEETLGYDARRLGLDFAVPFFVFNGDVDLVTPADLALDYFAAVAAPRKVFVLLPGGGHSVMLTMPDRFARALDRYVRPLCPGDGIT